MKKTRLGCTILEGSDVANLPLVSQNAQILDTEIDKVEKKGILTEKKITETNKNILDIEKDISERWGKKSKNISGKDLNDFIDSGLYVGNNLINAPGNYFCYVEVIGFYSTSGAYQRLRTWGSSGRTYERSKVNSNWQEWKQVANQDDIKIVGDRADAAFQSASEGKKVVAGAITGKGVPTSPTDTFQKMATNIGAIETDKTSDATALGGDIAKGKTAYSKGKKLVGTLELTGDALVTRVLAGNTFYSNDLKKKETGTMPNHGSLSDIITTQGGQINIPAGYYQSGTVKAQFPNLVSTNVKKGVYIGGVLGSYDPEPRFKIVTVAELSKENPSYHFSKVEGKLIGMSVDGFRFGGVGLESGDSHFTTVPLSLLSVSKSVDHMTITVNASNSLVTTTMNEAGLGRSYYAGDIHLLFLLD